MPNHKLMLATLACLLSGFSAAALAHPMPDAMHFFAGVLHPVSGLDHLLAAVAIGLWAARQGLRWLLPATFVLTMGLGMGLASTGIPVPGVEGVIVMSLLTLGVLLALTLYWPVVISMVLVAGFALFHGYAHGAELPQTSWLHAAGIMLATAALHGLGVVSATFIRSPIMWRSMGCILASFSILRWAVA